MGNIRVSYTPSESKVEVNKVLENFWEWEFLKLARQFQHHTCDVKERADCMVCEAFDVLDRGRLELSLRDIGREIEGGF